MGNTIPSFTLIFRVKRASVFLILAALWLPLAAYLLGWSSRPLGGAEWSPEIPKINRDSLADGTWQARVNQWAERNHPFRSDLIRANNQAVYWLFDRSTNYVVFGQRNQLFAYNHFEVYAGLKRRTPAHYARLNQDFQAISTALSAQGIPLLVVLAPNKARVLSDELPLSLQQMERREGDYSFFLSAVRSVPVLDLASVLQRKKATVVGPVFANTGLHWNQNGLYACMPALDSSLSRMLGRPPQGLHVDGGEWDDRLRLQDDADLAVRLDLVVPPPTQRQYYPRLTAKTLWKSKPKVLLISDSFGYTLVKTGALDVLSDDWEFWFYNKSVVKSGKPKRPMRANESSVRWREFDAVVIMATEYNLGTFPYGFSPSPQSH